MSTFALAGNPNSGKTSLFNLLTGSRQRVGNWPGVTVEKVIGQLKGDMKYTIVDLPGLYSLAPISIDEQIASRYMIEEKLDGIINIVDASNLERNLYFTIQLLEYGKPLFMALNMMDVAKEKGLHIDLKQLEERLGVKISSTVARKGIGKEDIIHKLKNEIPSNAFRINYGEAMESLITELEEILEQSSMKVHYSSRWFAIQFLEGNLVIEEAAKQSGIYEALNKVKERVEKDQQLNASQVIQNIRYQWISSLLKEVVQREQIETAQTLTDKIDRIVTNKWLGIPIFLAVMYFIFQITFTWIGNPLLDLVDGFIGGTLSGWVEAGLIVINSPDWMISLAVDGIVGGVGGVLVFVPNILVLFLLLSFLEDTGYMTRVAFIMDKFMSKMGLNGKSIIPMVIGFGCNIPGIMGSRTIEDPNERLTTILMNPFMSCSARMPVYALFAGVFFANNQGLIVFSLYFLGIVMAILLAFILKLTKFKQSESVFIMELPEYRLPVFKNLLLHTWDKGKGFIRKAGTIIFSMAVLIWFLSNFSFQGMVDINHSFLAALGSFIAPIFKPLGFGDWQASVALLTGFLAKEVVVSTMMVIYGTGESVTGLSQMIQGSFSALSAYAYMVFVLLYVPCLATVAAIKKETASWKWTFFSIGYSIGIAWLMAFIIYQVGKLFI